MTAASLLGMARSSAATKLAKYRSQRDFSRTTEPSGSRAPGAAGNSFVIHKHAARRLHYDLRLELDGVLLSWAVPKGPSLSPTEKRLAVRTEDHPLDYAGFEGVIPQGQYGAGSVVVWDHGTWEPEGDPHAAMTKGHLAFTLHGEKLSGRWHLVRTRGTDKHENWLLFKSRDDAANENLDITAAKPASVLSGRTVEQVTAAPVAELISQLPVGFPLSNLDKVLYPDRGITKAELIAYFAVVADWMLPHVADRPLTIVRCPEGYAKPCFFQKHVLAGSPPSIRTLPIEEASGEIVEHMCIRDMPGLVALAQLGTLEIHTWGSRADKPERPDVMVFDLDPDVSLGWDHVALAAFAMRRKLHDLGLASFVKTTGGKGLHVVVPVARRQDWDDFKAFAKAVASAMAVEAPARYTTNPTKQARKGKVFLDYLRNGRAATFIAPYSPRAHEGAPVATPITWEELAHGVDPLAFDIASVPRRLAKLPADPWKDIYDLEQSITAAAWNAVGGKP